MNRSSGNDTAPVTDQVRHARWNAVRELHHRYFVGLILYALQKAGTQVAADMMEQTFARQRGQKFLDSIDKLGLSGLPPAEMAAKYLYLANGLGGVDVATTTEANGRSWIYYGVPRWMYDGTAICAIPPEVSSGPMRGFHSRIGESLGVPSLSYVCVGQTAEGHPGLEGFFEDLGRPLEPHERLRFESHHPRPTYDPAGFPQVDWSPERRLKVARNYALTYLTNALPSLIDVAGAAEAAEIGHGAGLRIGMHYYAILREQAGVTGDFGDFLLALLHGMDEAPERLDATTIRQPGWHLMRGREDQRLPLLRAWSGLVEGCLLAHDRTMRFGVETDGDGIVWRFS